MSQKPDIAVRETYLDWQRDYTLEEWRNYRGLPIAGCGPYLMTKEMMQPEQENKMSEETNMGTMGALVNQIVEATKADTKSREEWFLTTSELAQMQYNPGPGTYVEYNPHERFIPSLDGQHIVDRGPPVKVTYSIFSDSAMTVTQNVCEKHNPSAGVLNEESVTAALQQLRAAQATPPEKHHHVAWPWPAPSGSTHVILHSKDYDKALQRSRDRAGRISELEHRLHMLEDILQSYEARAEDQGDHPYHGPTAPDASGRNVPIPDESHERFYRSIGDVLSGKIIPAARRQMQDALQKSPKDPPTTASTSRPMPDKAVQMRRLEKGVRL